ncbi:MAG: hypothetical protein N2D54_00760, partial [Chloroflexota bacterium]
MLQTKTTIYRKIPPLLVVISMLSMTVFTVQPAAAIGELPPGVTRLADDNADDQYDFDTIVEMGGNAYFIRETNGWTIWKSDGTSISQVSPNDHSAWNLSAGNGVIFSEGYDSTNGLEPWVSDGTPGAGTYMIENIYPTTGYSYPYEFTPTNDGTDDKVYFIARNDTDGYELYVSVAPYTSVAQVENFTASDGSTYFDEMTAVPGNLTYDIFFEIYHPTYGNELFGSDGSSIELIQDINSSGTSSSYPRYITALGTEVFFQADDGTDTELWKSDGSTTTEIDLYTDSSGSSSRPQYIAEMGGNLFFGAYTSTNGNEPRISNGVNFAGTQVLKDIMDTPSPNYSSQPYYFTGLDTMVLFSADKSPEYGRELWASDGTEGGTVMLVDNAPGGEDGYADRFDEETVAEVNGLVYFAMNDGVHGSEIWQSDGTAAGTQLFADLNPGKASSQPYQLVGAGDYLYFVANIDGNGFDVYSYDTNYQDYTIFADGFESGDTS